MRNGFSLLVLSFFVSISSYALTIVSDLDDTIKITNVKTLSAIENGLSRTDAFTGMPELMRSMQIDATPLIIVSGSPRFLMNRVERLMEKNSIPFAEIILTNGSNKKGEALELLMKRLNDDVILLGDDQEHDPNFYQNLQTRYPDQIKAVYIHQLNVRPLPVGQIPFYTAYEIALHEVAAGRLDLQGLSRVQESVRLAFADKKASEKLIPRWQECNAFSAEQVLSKVRRYQFADQNFLDSLSFIATRNCKASKSQTQPE